MEVVHIHGYLYKLTKEGKWQKRWFETNGSFLTYYKSKKMTKLLAALSLPQVGDIRLESEEGLFSITLHQRTYVLRAQTQEDAQKWVSTLSLLKKCPNHGTAKASPYDRPAHAMAVEATWQKQPKKRRCCWF